MLFRLAIDDHRRPELVIQTNMKGGSAKSIRGGRRECWEGGIVLS